MQTREEITFNELLITCERSAEKRKIQTSPELTERRVRGTETQIVSRSTPTLL